MPLPVCAPSSLNKGQLPACCLSIDKNPQGWYTGAPDKGPHVGKGPSTCGVSPRRLNYDHNGCNLTLWKAQHGCDDPDEGDPLKGTPLVGESAANKYWAFNAQGGTVLNDCCGAGPALPGPVTGCADCLIASWKSKNPEINPPPPGGAPISMLHAPVIQPYLCGALGLSGGAPGIPICTSCDLKPRSPAPPDHRWYDLSPSATNVAVCNQCAPPYRLAPTFSRVQGWWNPTAADGGRRCVCGPTKESASDGTCSSGCEAGYNSNVTYDDNGNIKVVCVPCPPGTHTDAYQTPCKKCNSDSDAGSASTCELLCAGWTKKEVPARDVDACAPVPLSPSVRYAMCVQGCNTYANYYPNRRFYGPGSLAPCAELLGPMTTNCAPTTQAPAKLLVRALCCGWTKAEDAISTKRHGCTAETINAPGGQCGRQFCPFVGPAAPAWCGQCQVTKPDFGTMGTCAPTLEEGQTCNIECAPGYVPAPGNQINPESDKTASSLVKCTGGKAHVAPCIMSKNSWGCHAQACQYNNNTLSVIYPGGPAKQTLGAFATEKACTKRCTLANTPSPTAFCLNRYHGNANKSPAYIPFAYAAENPNQASGGDLWGPGAQCWNPDGEVIYYTSPANLWDGALTAWPGQEGPPTPDERGGRSFGRDMMCLCMGPGPKQGMGGCATLEECQQQCQLAPGGPLLCPEFADVDADGRP